MKPFDYSAASDAAGAISRARSGARYIAGGTELIQLLQDGVESPDEIVDISNLPLGGVKNELDGVRIGALTKLADIADDPFIGQRYPIVKAALEETASPQVRNMATAGGNLLQRTRCLYFRDPTTPCNKRQPGSGCSALHGRNRLNAILGGSEHCIAANPSDFATALVALDAEVVLAGPDGERSVVLDDFYRIPGDRPEIDTVLEPGEMIIAIWLPLASAGRPSRYLKVRDRASFEWALASCAVALGIAEGEVLDARVAVGGVATKPWRLRQVEDELNGWELTPELARQAALRATEGAEGYGENGFKIELMAHTVERAIIQAGGI